MMINSNPDHIIEPTKMVEGVRVISGSKDKIVNPLTAKHIEGVHKRSSSKNVSEIKKNDFSTPSKGLNPLNDKIIQLKLGNSLANDNSKLLSTAPALKHQGFSEEK